MKASLKRLAWLVGFMLLALPAIERGLGGQTVEHHFAVPDTTARIVSYLPMVSEYLPNEDYDRWWHEIAACERLWLPFDYVRVRFFQINAIHFYDKDRPSLFWKDGELWVRWAVGQTYVEENAIFLSVVHRAEESVVKHEMLHLLLHWNRIPPGEDFHPMPFYGQCGMSVIYERPPKA